MDIIADHIENIKALFHIGTFSWIYAFCGAVFGSAMGSFTDVVADRTLENRKWWGRERSRCPVCDKILSPIELIPIVSFIVQKRRCRGCGSLIPFECLIAELGCAFLYGVLWGFHNPLTIPWILGSLLVPLFMIHIITDLKSMVLCDSVTLLILIFTFAVRIYGSFISNGYQVGNGILGSLIACGGFLILSMFGVMGFGDTVLMAGLGMITGTHGILFNIYSASLMSVFYYFLMIGIRCVARTKENLHFITLKEAGGIAAAGREVPYGPWLCLGAYFWILFFV
jgi:leader peptidase (prepilin peptidase)/N-methyltransferase